jgi:hypothetical protein
MIPIYDSSPHTLYTYKTPDHPRAEREITTKSNVGMERKKDMISNRFASHALINTVMKRGEKKEGNKRRSFTNTENRSTATRLPRRPPMQK